MLTDPSNVALPLWLKYLPGSVRSRIEASPDLLKILPNIAWLSADKVVRLTVGLVVTIWLARYLGPEQFGLLSYAIAFVALFGGLSSLGLNVIVVRDLVKSPALEGETVGSAFFLQLAGGVLVFALTSLAILFVRPDDSLLRLMVGILGFAVIFKATDVIKYWFESEVQSKYPVRAENAIFLLMGGVKIGMILGQVPLIYFAWVLFVEGLLLSVALSGLYFFRGRFSSLFRFSFARAGRLLQASWPLLFSGALVLIHFNMDKIMIGQMLGQGEVGVYAAATKLVEVFYFIPIAIASSVAPKLTLLFQQDKLEYLRWCRRVMLCLAAVALMLSLFIAMVAGSIIDWAYGGHYEEAGRVLVIHVWACVFVFHISFRSRLLAIESLQKFIFIFALLSAVVNLLLNLMLISRYGVVGASYASLFSWMACAVLFPLMFRETRIFLLQLTGRGSILFGK